MSVLPDVPQQSVMQEQARHLSKKDVLHPSLEEGQTQPEIYYTTLQRRFVLLTLELTNGFVLIPNHLPPGLYNIYYGLNIPQAVPGRNTRYHACNICAVIPAIVSCLRRKVIHLITAISAVIYATVSTSICHCRPGGCPGAFQPVLPWCVVHAVLL